MSEVTQTSSPITKVHIDGHALLKIVRHCKDSLPTYVSGTLLGVDVGDVLEITNCFPEEIDPKGAPYTMEMMKALSITNTLPDANAGKDVNVSDATHIVNANNAAETTHVANNVGWYISQLHSDFITPEFLADQFSHQNTLTSPPVCIVYDPYTTEKGRIPIKALRFTQSFMDFYRAGKFSGKDIQKFNIKSTNIFEEIPIYVKNSALAQAFLYELNQKKIIPSNAERLNTSNGALISKLIDSVSGTQGCIDEYLDGQDKYRAAQSSITRQRAEFAKKVDSINEDNERRKRHGIPLLPVPDIASAKLTEPSRLESLAVTSRIDMLGQELTNLAGTSYTNQAILAAFMKAGANEEQ